MKTDRQTETIAEREAEHEKDHQMNVKQRRLTAVLKDRWSKRLIEKVKRSINAISPALFFSLTSCHI